MTNLAQSPSEQRREIASWLASEDASRAPLEDVQAAAVVIESDAIGFAEDHASEKQKHFQQVFETRLDNGRRADIFAAMGANRSGKTYVGCWMCFAKHLRDRAQAGDVYWCIAPTLDRSIAGQQKELWQSLPRAMFGKEMWQEKIGFGGHRKIVLDLVGGGKCVVEFHSADQEAATFEQEKVSGIWVDESLPEAIYNRLLARIIDKRGFIIITDIYEQFWYMERLAEAEPAAGVYFQVLTMFDNEGNLPPGEIQAAMARMTAEEQDLRIHGKLVRLEGIVFKQYNDAVHAIDDFLGPVPEEWPKWRKIDYGETSPMACSWSTISPAEHIYVYREHYERRKSIFANAKMIHEASGATWREVERGKDDLHEKPWTQLVVEGGEQYACTFLDPACFSEDKDNGSLLSIAQQFADAGIKCKPWPRVNEMGEHAMVQKFKYRLEVNTWHVFKSCTFMRREMRSWKHKTDKDGNPVANDAYENGNNHLIDGQKGFISTNPTFAQKVVSTWG